MEDLFLLGFSDYMAQLSRHIYDDFLLDPEFFFASPAEHERAYADRKATAFKVMLPSLLCSLSITQAELEACA